MPLPPLPSRGDNPIRCASLDPDALTTRSRIRTTHSQPIEHDDKGMWFGVES